MKVVPAEAALRIEKRRTQGSGRVFDALAKSLARFLCPCGVPLQMLLTQAPVQERHSVRTTIGEPKRLQDMRPRRVGVEEAASDRWIPPLGNMLQQRVGQPSVRDDARIDVASPKEVTHHLPTIDAV